jgi:gas vesicle protein
MAGVIQERRDLPVAENKRDCRNFLKGVVIGGVMGAMATIFFAPKSGKELRTTDIKEKGSEVLHNHKEICADASTRAKEIIDEAKELKKEADRLLSAARKKAREILAHYEKVEAEADEREEGVTGGKKT